MLRKAFLLTALSLLSSASADKFGAYVLGVQYVQELSPQNAMRYSLSVPLFLNTSDLSAFSLAGDVSYLYAFKPRTQIGLEPYAGLGLLAGYGGFASSNSSGGLFIVGPEAFVGVDYNFNTQWSIFLEGGAAGAFAMSANANVPVSPVFQVAPSLRIGLNYKFK